MPPSKPNPQDFCPCHPTPEDAADRQRKREAFCRKYENFIELLKSVAAKYPDDTTSADLLALETFGAEKPKYPAGCLSQALDFDGMVAEASYHLFGKIFGDGQLVDSMNTPDFESVATEADVLERSFAKFLFDYYLGGGCLSCQLRLEHAGRESEDEKQGQRILQFLLSLFDLSDEPIPFELRQWSKESRFRDPPPRPQHRPTETWLRNRGIIKTVATLAYLTGKYPTRNPETRPKSSCCDVVVRAYARYGTKGIRFTTVINAWNKTKVDGAALGPAMLKRWREQDQKENQALSEKQLDNKRARAIRRWDRQPYWRQRNRWDES